jgi:signal peptidase II
VYVLGITLAAAFLTDRGTKRLVARYLAEGQVVGVGWLRIHRVTHRRGWLRVARHRGALPLLWGTASVGVVLVDVVASHGRQPALSICLGTALGGATANAWDWFRHGGVLDFIDLRVWPIFNLADVAIVTGVAGAIWCLH